MAVVGKETQKLIGSHGPAHPTRQMHCGSDNAVRVSSMTDGTTTVVQMLLYGEPIGTGIAKRRKGDERNDDLGMAIALTRCFTDAAARYAQTIDGILNPPADPSAKAVKELRRMTKDDTRRRKNIRREKARRLHRESHGWDHMNRPTE